MPPPIQTTNKLSPIHGDSPIGAPPNRPPSNPYPPITRGFIIYLEFLGSKGGGGIFARTFYKDFPDGDLRHHADFEKSVIAEGNAGTIGNAATYQEYPDVFDNQIATIHFGWQPCRVSYILNAPFAEFVGQDPAQPDIQPVVFRDDKVVIDSAGNATKPKYERNHSFYNLRVIDVDDASVLRMDNFMLINKNGDPLGPKPENPHNHKLEYCMDILIKFDPVRFVQFTQNFSKANLDTRDKDSRERIFDPAALSSIIIVFDPPQDNGGGSGPP